MNDWYCKITITTGRGNERWSVCAARNICAIGKQAAIVLLEEWAAYDLNLREFMHSSDARIETEASLGAARIPDARG